MTSHDTRLSLAAEAHDAEVAERNDRPDPWRDFLDAALDLAAWDLDPEAFRSGLGPMDDATIEQIHRDLVRFQDTYRRLP